MVLHPFSRMVGHPDADVWNHAWGPWWFWESLSSGTLPWHTDLLHAPAGGTLWFIDPMGALLAAPLVPVFGVVGAWNLLILGYLSAASWGAWSLACRITDRGNAWLASVAVLLGPYLVSEVHNGISEAVNLAPGLVALALGDRAFREGGRRTWILLGVSLAVTALGSAYYLLAVGVVLAVWALPWLVSRPTASELGSAAAGGAVAGAGAAGVGACMWASIQAGDALVFRADAPTEALELHNAVNPLTYIAPGGFQSVDLTQWGEAFLHSGYLGLILVVLAGMGLRTTRRWDWLAAIGVSLVVGLGSYLFVSGAYVEVGAGSRLALPHRFLVGLLPPQALTHSLRLAMPGIVLVAALAAAGLASVSAAKRGLLVAAVVVDLLFSNPLPLATTSPLESEYAEWIAEQPGDGIVLDLPANVGNTMATSRYAVQQSVHGKPIPYRPDVRGSTSALLGVPAFLPLVLASEHRDEHRGGLAGALEDAADPDPAGLFDRGVRWIVLHTELERGQEGTGEIETILSGWFGAPQAFGDHRVWVLDLR
jgi:hypothetical protein